MGTGSYQDWWVNRDANEHVMVGKSLFFPIYFSVRVKVAAPTSSAGAAKERRHAARTASAITRNVEIWIPKVPLR